MTSFNLVHSVNISPRMVHETPQLQHRLDNLIQNPEFNAEKGYEKV
jgi:hypothetical protein